MQSVLVVLFIAALIVGALTMKSKSIDESNVPQASMFKQMMGTIGFTNVDNKNKKTTERFVVEVENGITSIREKMMLVEDQRLKMMDRVKEQQQILANQRINMQDLLARLPGDIDLTHTKDLVAAFENQERILAQNGREMEMLSEQMRAKAQHMKDQMEMAALAREQDEFMAKASNYGDNARNVSAQMTSVADRMLSSYAGPDKPVLQTRMQEVIARQRDLAESLKADRESLAAMQSSIQQRFSEQKIRIDELVERNETKIQDAKQRQEDQKQLMKDRISSQMERAHEIH